MMQNLTPRKVLSRMKHKKTLVSINLANGGSTGRIMSNISSAARNHGYTTYQIYPDNDINRGKFYSDIIVCSKVAHKIYQRICRYTGFNGCSAVVPTIRVLKKLDKIKPDIIHLHNLHNSYINLPLLFRYIKKNNIPVVWTLHDCWAFTGHCPHFIYQGCEKWKIGCYGCTEYKKYPISAFDDSKRMYALKKKWFLGVKNMQIITPSKWLADLVKQSYLKEYPVRVINNGIDLSVFHPEYSDFREKFEIDDSMHIVLSVAFGWGEKKGLDIMIRLAETLPSNYKVVIVGTNAAVDKRLPEGMISIHRTHNQQELIKIYSAADLFVIPTREDNYPTVNMEAIACGTPVLTFDVGGSAEIIDSKTGAAVKSDDFNALYREVIRICEQKPYTQADCLNRAKMFDVNKKNDEYIDIYSKMI